MADNWYRDNFLKLARDSQEHHLFIADFSLSVGSVDDYDGPLRHNGDLIEIDPAGRLHLWLFAPLRSAEIAGGGIIGRLFAYTQAFRTPPSDILRTRIEAAARRRGYDTGAPALRRALTRLRRDFSSWNVVICGGRGCELAGRDDNPLFRLYAPLSDMIGAIPDVNTWHFYGTRTGFDLRSLWDVAALGQLSLNDRLAIYAGRGAPLPAPADDFDIASKRDLHMSRRKGVHHEGFQAYFTAADQILAR
ncbi:MAG: hypothetical protein ACM33T_08490 [Solirubrobacterales bacterium]